MRSDLRNIYIVNKRYGKRVDGFACTIDADERYIPRRILFAKTPRRNVSARKERILLQNYVLRIQSSFWFLLEGNIKSHILRNLGISYPLDILKFSVDICSHTSELYILKSKNFLPSEWSLSWMCIRNSLFISRFGKRTLEPNPVHLSRVKLCPGKRKIFACVDHY